MLLIVDKNTVLYNSGTFLTVVLLRLFFGCKTNKAEVWGNKNSYKVTKSRMNSFVL